MPTRFIVPLFILSLTLITPPLLLAGDDKDAGKDAGKTDDKPAAKEEAKPNTLTKAEKEAGFVLLFDGKSLDGWKAAENPDGFKVENGKIIVQGKRGHLFYTGDVAKHNFKNFELRTKVYIHPKSNSGIYVHTTWKEKGWPTHAGYEAQVCSNDYRDPKKTGSIYNYKNLKKSPVKDGEWFDYHVIVKGRTITTVINGKTAAEFTEPDDEKKQRLKGGTFALQCHDPNSKVEYHTIRVRVLPDEKKDDKGDKAKDDTKDGKAGQGDGK